MSKVILYTAVTLDGYIADVDGSIDFLENPNYTIPDEDYGYETFLEQIDVVLMGFNTYEQVRNFEGPYPYSHKKTVVLSHDETIVKADPSVEITSLNASEVVERLQNEGKTVWIVGGGATNAALHEKGLIDEMILTITPNTLGAGVPLFRENAGKGYWKTKEVNAYPNGLVQLHLIRS
jgi:dihydrofolate reductase